MKFALITKSLRCSGSKILLDLFFQNAGGIVFNILGSNGVWGPVFRVFYFFLIC
jgi:hypothetical protein